MSKDRILIIDDTCKINKANIRLISFDKILYASDIQKPKLLIRKLSIPDFDYSKIEKLAYDLCEIEMRKVLSEYPFLTIKESFKEAIKKNMLQIYGYYYKKAKILDLINRFSDADITICSNYIEENEIKNCKILNNYHLLNLYLSLMKNILRHIISPLLHNNIVRFSKNTIVSIDAMAKMRLFEYYFPFIKKYEVLLLSDKKLPRVKKFIQYCDENNIKYYEYKNSSFINTAIAMIKIIFKFGLPRNYKEYLVMNYYMDNLYAYIGFEEAFIKNNIKYFIMSDEFNSKSNLISFLCKKKRIKLFNFQHGGIYLANHDYDNFIVMGKWIKDYYIKNTKSEKSQFLALGNPFLDRNKGFDKSKLKKKKLDILFMGQYLFGYNTRQRKEDILKCIRELSKIPDVNITIKDHPGARDNLASKYFNESNARILENNDNYEYKEYDLVLSFYSTTLIESVMCSVPSISLNFDRINGILLLEKSKVRQVSSCKELLNMIMDIKADRKKLIELYKGEIENVKTYWNRDIDVFNKLRNEFGYI